ncbi:hypothetical protein KY092_13575 [Natronomonas gomsonensis]|uniref:hypothetical protein n=1 Tax=Natronomonas gomsonensis TaxID=1046043 RepID=UPI0020CA7AFC|nr:hypothetical protein [Natronomonas gomsonensis]MCY4731584.1 hypothetical protein [Natronomonas gomsonensis]
MYTQRDHLVTLLNALYDSGVSSIPVKHPCDDIGELLRIELEAAGQATVRFTKGAVTYRDARETIELEYVQERTMTYLTRTATFALSLVVGWCHRKTLMRSLSLYSSMVTRILRRATTR